MQRHKLTWMPSVALHHSYMTRGHVAQRWHSAFSSVRRALGHGPTFDAYMYSYYFTGCMSNGVDIVDTGVKKQ